MDLECHAIGREFAPDEPVLVPGWAHPDELSATPEISLRLIDGRVFVAVNQAMRALALQSASRSDPPQR